MVLKTDTQKYANVLFAINLLTGLILFCTVTYFYQGSGYEKALYSLATLTIALALGIVNRRDILQSSYF